MLQQEKRPRVSVITVVKNGERYLAEAVQSVLNQTYQPDEIIVVDGQSTDQTAFIARSFTQVRYILQPDQGLANARNLGIDAAQGTFIAFLDHDDLWTTGKLETQMEFMAERPDLLYTTIRMRFAVEPGAPVRSKREQEMLANPRDGSTPSALVARRAAFEVIGRFNPDYSIGCDADWFTRARDQNVPTAVLPQVLLYKRLHQKNLSVNAAVNRQEMFLIASESIRRQRRSQ
jgi:glycosyltransferase involved in cell wall biosynthesis